MAFTHIYTQVLTTPEEQWADGGVTATSDTVTAVATTVDVYGGATNAVAIAFGATNAEAGLQSLGLLASVPCTVTLTGATTVDGVGSNIVTLAANVMRRIASVTGGAVSGIIVSANTEAAGLAGTIKISALFKS
jgi:hypothetical protein